MKFKKAMHIPTPEEQKRLNDFIEKVRTEQRKKNTCFRIHRRRHRKSYET